MKWNEFKTWQRWDEFPDLVNNPPMTVDFSFTYKRKQYFVEKTDNEYQILDSNWNTVLSNSNFLFLLSSPIWDGKSFKDVIENILFES